MKYLIFPALLLTALFLACSTNPVIPPVFDLTQGAWSGELQIDTIPLTFTVVGDAVTGFQVTLLYDFGGHTPDSTVVWTMDDFSAADDSFSVFEEVTGDAYSFSFLLEGTFTPPGNVNGDIFSQGVFHDTFVADTVTIESTWEAFPI
jgi:hypothetical protein